MGLLAVAALRVGAIQLATNFATVVGAVSLSLSTVETVLRLWNQAKEQREKKAAP